MYDVCPRLCLSWSFPPLLSLWIWSLSFCSFHDHNDGYSSHVLYLSHHNPWTSNRQHMY
jgi:hypothetical protein